MSNQFLIQRIAFREDALNKLYAAYTALLDGGVKAYTINDRQLTRLDLPALAAEIKSKEAELDELKALCENKKPRKSVGVIPRDW